MERPRWVGMGGTIVAGEDLHHHGGARAGVQPPRREEPECLADFGACPPRRCRSTSEFKCAGRQWDQRLLLRSFEHPQGLGALKARSTEARPLRCSR